MGQSQSEGHVDHGGHDRASSLTKLVGFDFDCTLTVRHFYKVMAWGYLQCNLNAHPHCKAFGEWCKAHDVPSALRGTPDFEEPMTAALDDFCQYAGDEAFSRMFREFFLGGEDRIRGIGEYLTIMSRHGIEFAIVTAGTSSAVVRALTVVPEWSSFFPSSRIWDTQQGRHLVASTMSQKALMLRDISPNAKRILLVDDSASRDPAPEWVLRGAAVDLFKGDLPYEGPGIDMAGLKEIHLGMAAA